VHLTIFSFFFPIIFQAIQNHQCEIIHYILVLIYLTNFLIEHDNPIPIWWPIYCASLIFYLEDFLGYLKILNLQVNLIISRSHFGLKSKEFVMSFNAES